MTNTTWENLQIATHKSVSFTPHIILICALQWGLFIKMATDWEVSEVGDTCRPAAGPGRGRSVQIEWISAGSAHLGFPALWSVPHLLSREIKMNRRHLQIFSGCVCHLEQLHAQSPFLFPIVFSINLIPFFDICSVDLFAVFQPGCSGTSIMLLCYFTWAAARSQQLLFVVLAAGLWCLTAGCHVKSPLFPQPPLKQKCAPRSRWEKAYMRKHTYK